MPPAAAAVLVVAVHAMALAGWPRAEVPAVRALATDGIVRVSISTVSGPSSVPRPNTGTAVRATAAPLQAEHAERVSHTVPSVDVAAHPTAEHVLADQLWQPPVPLDDIVVTFPDGVGGSADTVVRLALYIGENGQVEQVEVEAPGGAPAALVEAARAAFAAARFSPGIDRGDRVVRSVLRVEVRFDASSAA